MQPEGENLQEEIQNMTEGHEKDHGLAPVSLTRQSQSSAPPDDLAQIEMQIYFLEEKLAELQAQRAELAGEEPEAPDFTDDDIRDEVRSFLLAGAETASNVLTWFFANASL